MFSAKSPPPACRQPRRGETRPTLPAFESERPERAGKSSLIPTHGGTDQREAGAATPSNQRPGPRGAYTSEKGRLWPHAGTHPDSHHSPGQRAPPCHTCPLAQRPKQKPHIPAGCPRPGLPGFRNPRYPPHLLDQTLFPSLGASPRLDPQAASSPPHWLALSALAWRHPGHQSGPGTNHHGCLASSLGTREPASQSQLKVPGMLT